MISGITLEPKRQSLADFEGGAPCTGKILSESGEIPAYSASVQGGHS